MALELMPDGLTFKKLTKIQTEALDRFYNRGKKEDRIDTLIQSPIFPSIVFGSVATAALVATWAYLKDLELPSIESFFESAGGGIADITSAVFGADPKSPQFIPSIIPGKEGELVEVPRCKRWEIDATEWLRLNQATPNKGRTETIFSATYGLSIIKNMKREGCPKPNAFTQSQWNEGKI